MGATAVRMSPVWDDPAAVTRLIRGAGPFWPLANYAASEAEMAALGRRGPSITPPWFRQDFVRQGVVLVPGAELMLGNERFLEGAQRLGGGPDAVVRPQAVYVNIMGPTPFSFPPHLDIPAFRGFTRATQPVWLLKTMKTSGLFEAWRTTIATAVSWFYGGPGGDFAYWPDGPEASAALESAPFDNVGVIADNEATFHGVTALGAPGTRMIDGLTRESRLVRGTDGWDVRDEDGRIQAHLSDDEVRLTVSWKADVFSNEDEAALYDRGDDELTLATVIDLLNADLMERGFALPTPTDPLTDQEWISALAAVYEDPSPRLA